MLSVYGGVVSCQLNTGQISDVNKATGVKAKATNSRPRQDNPKAKAKKFGFTAKAKD